MSANEQKIGHFLIDLQRTTIRQNNSDSQIAVYYHPCNQNTNNHFGPLKQEEITKLTFVIVSKLFLVNRPIPLCLFLVLFVNFPSYYAVKYVQQLENISKSSKYCLGYIFKGQKVLNERMKLENNKPMQSNWLSSNSWFFANSWLFTAQGKIYNASEITVSFM